ncbi:hypothetical protein TELCIR_02984 [Teladorsagia circumcincta]|uniref:Peptidase S1 domain-containing protein n=1 Tax=Teladorsagia circumcincta TaxID=45464 RepID=A0A2G9UXN4_TELCI|nr:hypothetical protein TELCIR_02984 [Teladorsagia circumcincta]
MSLIHHVPVYHQTLINHDRRASDLKHMINNTAQRGSMSLSFGGRHVRDGEYPWLVTIALKGIGNGCSGALISQRHVLTAAHCVRKASKEVPKEEECKKLKHKEGGEEDGAKAEGEIQVDVVAKATTGRTDSGVSSFFS